jgi:hypothetical protein
MIAGLEYRPPWAGMRFAAWARNATGKRFMSNSIHGSSRILSLQLFLPAIPLFFIAQVSMLIEVFEAEEVRSSSIICGRFAGAEVGSPMLLVSY